LTVMNSRRTRQRVYRVGLIVSTLWLLVTVWWCYVVVLALREVDVNASLVEQIQVFDMYETNITRGAVVGSALFAIRVVMFLQWPDARLLWRSWRR
jgi:hypothetical protein